MINLSEELKEIKQRYLNNVKEDITKLNNELNSICNYLINNINSDLKTLNSVLYEKDKHKKEFITIVYTASLEVNIYYYNKYFSIYEIKGNSKTGDSYQWIEKREYKIKKDDHEVYCLVYDIIEFTEPKLNNTVNYNFIVDKQKNIIFTDKSFFDLSKVNNNLRTGKEVVLWGSKVIEDNPDRNKLSKETIDKRLKQNVLFI